MLFPTTVFAIFFLVVFTGNWFLSDRVIWRKWFLLLASYLFYGWWDWRFLLLIIGCSVVNHALAILLDYQINPTRRRILLITAIVFDLGMLGLFKYYKFFVVSAYALLFKLNLSCHLPLLDIVLPVGISFFTFQALSYVIDVYRKEIPVADSLLDFSVYLAFFPQLVAGPIVRAKVLLPQFQSVCPKSIDTGRASMLIMAGLFKKVVIANLLAQHIVDPVFDNPGSYPAPDVIIAVYGYAMQIYCDFSAYSDIAIGVALLLGFHFPINFNAPYFAYSFRDFWKRWHISLSSWLRDYLYIPLGGSRKGRLLTYRNLLLTFVLGGLWHGAQWKFVVWGCLHGVYLCGERVLAALLSMIPYKIDLGRLSHIVSGIVVFHLVCLAWVFFRVSEFGDAWVLLGQLSHWSGAKLVTLPILVILLVGFGMQLLDGSRMEPVWNWLNRQSFVLQGALAAFILTLILGMGPRGVAPFIYFQF